MKGIVIWIWLLHASAGMAMRLQPTLNDKAVATVANELDEFVMAHPNERFTDMKPLNGSLT